MRRLWAVGDSLTYGVGWRVDELAALDPVLADVVSAQAGTNDLIQRWAPDRPHAGTCDEFNEAQRALFAADVAARLEA